MTSLFSAYDRVPKEQLAAKRWSVLGPLDELRRKSQDARCICSDLPDDDRSTVLLLGVTRIPTSPAPTRRPYSLPFGGASTPHHNPILKHKLRKNSLSSSRSSIGRRSSLKARKGTLSSNRAGNANVCEITITIDGASDDYVEGREEEYPEAALSEPDFEERAPLFQKSQKQRPQFLNKLSPILPASLLKNKCKKAPVLGHRCDSDLELVTDVTSTASAPTSEKPNQNSYPANNLLSNGTLVTIDGHASNKALYPVPDFIPRTIMDRSVDSIGTCSLDVEGSVNFTDQSEQSSIATLRSIRLSSPEPEPHLPSYLSLACTVNGYSTTTNYNSERLSKSRDVSPHRFLDSDLTGHGETLEYSVRNNLLSPPNIVPLPSKKIPTKSRDRSDNMANQSISHHEYFSSSSRISFQNQDSKNYMSTACIEMGQYTSKCISSISSSTSTSYVRNNLENKSSSHKELSNGTENKSFIQQRVERLYGPGALAQGFFISKRLQGRSFDTCSENIDVRISVDNHSKSFDEGNGFEESGVKQAASSPTLPVLRHLRPEFRAQLPIMSPKKSLDLIIQKGSKDTTKEETGTNRQPQHSENGVDGNKNLTKMEMGSRKPQNGAVINEHLEVAKEDGEVIKDGHYFLNILDTETERLLKLAVQIETELETLSLSEEIKGRLRSASGKARLLTSQKMQQFRGLCANNISRREGEAFPTTNEDLQGFWDMVLLQVEQVDELFKEIDKLRVNNWVEHSQEKSRDVPDKMGKKANGCNGLAKQKKPVHSKAPTAASQEARKQRDALRKQMIEAKRKAMKEQQNKDNIQIFVPDSS